MYDNHLTFEWKYVICNQKLSYLNMSNMTSYVPQTASNKFKTYFLYCLFWQTHLPTSLAC